MKQRFLHAVVTSGVVVMASCSDAAAPDEAEFLLESLLTFDVAMVSADALIDDLAELQLGFVGGIGGALGAPPDRSRVVTFYDADGNEQERPMTTSRRPRSTLRERSAARWPVGACRAASRVPGTSRLRVSKATRSRERPMVPEAAPCRAAITPMSTGTGATTCPSRPS